jgi:uncharacterized protein YcbK (DUF882 family)
MTCRPTTIASRYSESVIQTGFAPAFSVVDILNKEANPADSYDATTLLRLSQNLNKTVISSDTSAFPLLNQRYQQSPILFSEVADFLDQSGLNINTVDTHLADYQNTITPNQYVPADSIPSDIRDIYSQLEFYYSENMANSISGGLCSAIANPFDKLIPLLDVLTFAGSILDTILSFDLASLANPLEALKSKLEELVDELAETLKKQLEGIVESATQFVTNIKAGAEKMIKKIKRMINNVKNFLQNTTVDSIKADIKKFIDKSVEQFKSLTPNAIALLLFRFCQFTEMVQAFMMGPIDALRQFAVNLTLQEQLVDKIGEYRTKDAVNAGAVRVDEEGVDKAKKRLVEGQNRAAKKQDEERFVFERPSSEFYVSANNLTDKEREGLLNLGDEGLEGRFKFNSSVLNMGKFVSDAVEGDGYRNVQPEVWTKLTIVARRMSKTFTINSGYRSPQYNDQVGGAKNSSHKSGLAIDVSMSGMSDEDIRKFIRTASQEGFMGIAYYSGSNFVHLDMGARRSWLRGHRFDNYIAMHLDDGFRTGSSSQISYPQTQVS